MRWLFVGLIKSLTAWVVRQNIPVKVKQYDFDAGFAFRMVYHLFVNF
jgi:hypothetical protein